MKKITIEMTKEEVDRLKNNIVALGTPRFELDIMNRIKRECEKPSKKEKKKEEKESKIWQKNDVPIEVQTTDATTTTDTGQ